MDLKTLHQFILKKFRQVWLILLMIMPVSHIFAENIKPNPIAPQTLDWVSPPMFHGLEFVWLYGAEDNNDLYALRVRLKKGTKIPLHTHPDKRLSTVLSGTLFVGFGESFNLNELVEVKKGESYIVPADRAHFIFAKDSNVVYQETGYGPTATEML